MARLAVVLACALAVPAEAGKLTDAQAKKTAADWIAAMHFGAGDDHKLDAATALTAPVLYAVAYDDEGAKCPETTATTPAALAKTLTCLHEHVAPSGKPKIWTKKAALRLGGPLLGYAKKIAALAKAAALVEINDGCDGTESWVILAITKDAKGDSRVSAILAQRVTCGE